MKFTLKYVRNCKIETILTAEGIIVTIKHHEVFSGDHPNPRKFP